MPRPCKRRSVCCVPQCRIFAPLGEPCESTAIVMSIEEYESVRLIDHEGLTQEQCASMMKVARTTVQAIYDSARRKLAKCLVEERGLRISGGDYELCTESELSKRSCGHKVCPRINVKQTNKKEKTNMRIAVTYENGEVFGHFGHTQNFKLYDVENGKVASSEVISTNGTGHGALAGLLNEMKVDALICGGIGGGAINALNEAGVELYAGVSGSCDAAVEALIKNELNYSADATCDHHHEGEHSCEENHSCGNGHTCGQ